MLRSHTPKISPTKLKEIKRQLKPHQRGAEFETYDGMVFRKTWLGIKRIK